MQPPLASFLLPILPLFADSNASLLLILPLIAHSIAFLQLMPHLVSDSSAASDCKVRALLAAVIKPHGGAGRSSRSAGFNKSAEASGLKACRCLH